MGEQHYETRTSKRIGELNGPWAMLFKVTQILIPIIAVSILPWGVWLTNTTYEQRERIAKIEAWMNMGPRFTANDAENLRLRVLNEVEAENNVTLNKVSTRLDNLTLAIQELKIELAKHTAVDTQRPK